MATPARFHWQTVPPRTGLPGLLQVLNLAGKRLEQAISTLIGPRVDGWSESLSASETWDPPSLAAGGAQTNDVTVTGAVLGDFALASHDQATADIEFIGTVSAADTVTVTMRNHNGGAVDLASGTLRVLVFRR